MQPATSSQPGRHEGNPAPAVQHRSRLHYLYYLLAAFDLVTVSLSLLLINQVAAGFEESVEVNQIWAARLNDFAELSRLAAAVNAPGNDVFETRDPAGESSRLETAVARFDDKVEALRGRLGDLAPEQSAVLLPALVEVEAAMARMVGEAGSIFVDFRTGDTLTAGQHMASMDRQYARVNLALAALTGHAQQFQEQHLVDMAARAADIRRFEWLIAGLILFMILGVTFYGQRLARQVREQVQLTEALVEKRTRELEESHERLRTAERLASIGTLAAGLGHDMNNVLFPVRCRLDVLDHAELPAASKEELRSVRDSLNFLQQLSDGLRLLSVDPDRESDMDDSTGLAAWARQVEPLLRTTLPREVEMTFDIAGDLPKVAVAPHRLTQAIFNLVVNAGEAMTGPGTVRITARPEAAEPSSIRLSVADSGHGMSDEVRRQALDPFFTTKKRRLSTGLGLALVNSVATAAGGSVEIESEPGRGTTVSMILPALSAQGTSDTPTPVPGGFRAAVSLKDQRLASFMEEVLAARGWSVERLDFAGRQSPAESAQMWVIDTTATSPDAAARFLEGPAPRHVILASEEVPDEWDLPGVIPLRGRSGLSAVLAAVEAAGTPTTPESQRA